MKRITKFFVTLGLCIGLFLGAEQQETKATGFPTIDVSNLLQNILSWIQDSIDNGLFSDISDIDMKITKWKEAGEQFQKVMQIIDVMNKGIRFGSLIVDVSSRFYNDIGEFERYSQWFQIKGAPTSYVRCMEGIIGDFQVFFTGLIEDTNEKNNFVNSMKDGDAIEILQAMNDFLENFSRQYYVFETHFRNEVRILHSRYIKMQMYRNNLGFMYGRYYY